MDEGNQTHWRIAVDIEFKLAATDQEAAIAMAEELLQAGMATLRPTDDTQVEVVMALPRSVESAR